MVEQELERDNPPVEVVERRYEAVKEILEAQERVDRDLKRHYQKMLRTTLLLLGVLATAGGYFSTSGGGVPASISSCSATFLGTCIGMGELAGAAAVFYVYSLLTFVVLSGTVATFAKSDQDGNRSEPSSEREYLLERTETLEELIDSNVEARKSELWRKQVSEVSLLMAVAISTVVGYSLLTSRPVGLLSAMAFTAGSVGLLALTGYAFKSVEEFSHQ